MSFSKCGFPTAAQSLTMGRPKKPEFMCRYVCGCVCLCAHVCACIHVCSCVHVCVRVYTCVYVYAGVCVCVCDHPSSTPNAARSSLEQLPPTLTHPWNLYSNPTCPSLRHFQCIDFPTVRPQKAGSSCVGQPLFLVLGRAGFVPGLGSISFI
jgi:hypothetical protein